MFWSHDFSERATSRGGNNQYKRKRLDEEAIEVEFLAQEAERKKRKTYRPIVKQLQLLHDQWRNTNDEWERHALETDIQDLQDELELMEVELSPQLEHLMYPPIEYEQQSRVRGEDSRIAFGPAPTIAFFPVKKKMRKSPRQRMASEGELERHRQEMLAAMEKAHEKGFSYMFG